MNAGELKTAPLELALEIGKFPGGEKSELDLEEPEVAGSGQSSTFPRFSPFREEDSGRQA